MTDDETTTKSTRTRWELTGTAAALALVTTTCALTTVYVWRGQTVPLWLASSFSLSTLAGVAWAFGESALRAAKSARGGDA